MNDNEILKNYMREHRYSECIYMLKNKIIDFVINQIKIKDNTFSYTTILDLISGSEFYLNDCSIANSLNFALIEENELDQIEKLLFICKEHNIR